MKKQVFNPFLPLDECIPDGEPHVFGDRVYLYGSHDKPGGDTFCMLPYVVWSAPIDDLSDWTNKGVSYEALRDPLYSEKRPHMYAPDCVRGNDGRYYLYYALAGYRGVGGYDGPISVAVCDTPDGSFEYLGVVKNPDGTPFDDYVMFDPAVINDEGVIRLYSGTCYPFDNRSRLARRLSLWRRECEMFHRTMKEVKRGIMGAVTVELEDDMLTVKTKPRLVVPTLTKNTPWAEHPFFEASSIRRIGETYYFIYSSQKNHELCYATSRYPDRDFVFRGTIVSNGDVGLAGRGEDDRLNHTATNHGSIECIGGQWYVFYHRQTHGTDYSRQACAERITILPDGSIPQVGITSCGLNGAPLAGKGSYPAAICCCLTNGHMPHGGNSEFSDMPMIVGGEGEVFIRSIENGTLIGYKSFMFSGCKSLSVKLRGSGSGTLEVRTEPDGAPHGSIAVSPSEGWTAATADVSLPDGESPLYLFYNGSGKVDMLELILISY